MILRLQLVEVPIQSKENILRNFLRRAAIAKNAIRNAVDPRLVPFHNVTKPISRRRDRCYGWICNRGLQWIRPSPELLCTCVYADQGAEERKKVRKTKIMLAGEYALGSRIRRSNQ